MHTFLKPRQDIIDTQKRTWLNLAFFKEGKEKTCLLLKNERLPVISKKL